MFKSIRQRFRDMKTIKNLCFEAERIANIDGHKEPGAEHFVLSALALPDGTARKAFARISANPDQFHVAITQQYEDALRNVGIELPNDVAMNNAPPIPTSAGPYKTQPSAQALMHTLTREIMVKYQKENSAAPLLRILINLNTDSGRT